MCPKKNPRARRETGEFRIRAKRAAARARAPPPAPRARVAATAMGPACRDPRATPLGSRLLVPAPCCALSKCTLDYSVPCASLASMSSLTVELLDFRLLGA
jgi:hypothetical protein